MKFVKLSVLALSLGLFVASCGNAGGEAAKTDTVVAPAAEPVAEPAPAPAPVADTTAQAATTTTVTETKTEVKH